MDATINIPGAWHYGMIGTVVRISTQDGLITIRFDGHGTVTVPLTVVRFK